MCGIGGVVEELSRESGFDNHAAVMRMVHSINHRGPDSNGVRTLPSDSGRQATLGAVRLRVIDLAAVADQPLSDGAGEVWTVFNGELYNHRELRAELCAAGFTFKSASDTECLVHLYRYLDGDAHRLASRLRGMFAFALWDAKAGRLVIARDRLGIKPLLWTRTPNGLAFCSEQRALAWSGVVSGSPNIDAISGFLAKGVVSGGSSIVAGIERLLPGHLMTWEGGSPTTECWWRPVISCRADLLGEAPAQAAVTTAVSDAVGRHLVADRPVGIFLSSGTDSAVLAAVASRAGVQRTLTVRFPDVPELDEGSVAADTSSRLGLDHSEVPVTAADALSALPDVLRSFDSPTADGFNSWLICGAAKQAGLVVALSGIGGDELFAGYNTFRYAPRLRHILRLVNRVPSPARHAARRRSAHHATNASARARAFQGGEGMSGAYHLIRRIFDDDEIESAGMRVPTFPSVPNDIDPVDAITLLELRSYLRDQLLPDADTTSMAHSIELRVPLLDDRVIDTSLSLTPSVRSNGKQMLATAAGLGARPTKRPFVLPMQQWVATSLRETMRGALLDDSLPFADVIPRTFRERLWRTPKPIVCTGPNPGP